jgi:hypothetical protein
VNPPKNVYKLSSGTKEVGGKQATVLINKRKILKIYDISVEKGNIGGDKLSQILVHRKGHFCPNCQIW